jgi:hypothetical protein
MLSSLVTLFVFLQIGTGCASLSINHKKQILVIIKIRLDSFIPHTNTKAFYLKEKQSISFLVHIQSFFFRSEYHCRQNRKVASCISHFIQTFNNSIEELTEDKFNFCLIRNGID